MPAERRSPDGIEADAREGENRLQENLATTEEPEDLPETFAVNGEGLPEKVFSLRRGRGLPGGDSPIAEGQDLSAAAGPASVHSQGQRHLAPVGESVPALVRLQVPPGRWSLSLGQCPPGAVRRRLRHPGEVRGAADRTVCRADVAGVDGAASEPGQDPHGEIA